MVLSSELQLCLPSKTTVSQPLFLSMVRIRNRSGLVLYAVLLVGYQPTYLPTTASLAISLSGPGLQPLLI